MRSFNSGRRSSCLKVVLLALVLSAPISLNAQSGSQSAQSASGSPPATQSQSQSTPACSDGRPILKRGKQPDLPPCPDPPMAASAPADSTRTRSPNPSEALIERPERRPSSLQRTFPTLFARRLWRGIGSEATRKRPWTLFRLKLSTIMTTRKVTVTYRSMAAPRTRASRKSAGLGPLENLQPHC